MLRHVSSTWQKTSINKVFEYKIFKGSHDCATYLRICANLGLTNAKHEKIVLISCICHNLTENFDCAKELAFRKSGRSHGFLPHLPGSSEFGRARPRPTPRPGHDCRGKDNCRGLNLPWCQDNCRQLKTFKTTMDCSRILQKCLFLSFY